MNIIIRHSLNVWKNFDKESRGVHCLGLGPTFRTVLGMDIMVIINTKYDKLFLFYYSLKESFHSIKVGS